MTVHRARYLGITFCGIFLLSAPLLAQSPAHTPLRFDLAKIGLVINGKQMCEDVDRLQDYPSKEMDRIIAAGTKSIPVLINMLTDERRAKTSEPIICFWPGMAIGDIAFCLLTNLFTPLGDSKSTIPGGGWDELLGPPGDRTAWTQLYEFVQKHGRVALRNKWQMLWNKYGAQAYWDPKERCFKLGTSK